jgi:uncharacterized membrane protein YoaK (UPF0700 family)
MVTSDREPVTALFVLTFTTGLVDAVSLLGLGRVFTANMTGNVVLLGFAIAGAGGFSIAATLTSLLAFLIGAAAGARFGRSFAARPHGWLASALALEVVLVSAAAVITLFGVSDHADLRLIVIALLALAMGARNAAVRALAAKDLTTTVLTMTLTGLAADSTLAGGPGTGAHRRVVSALFMLAGAIVGALFVLHVDLAVPLFLAAALAAFSLVTVKRPLGRTNSD